MDEEERREKRIVQSEINWLWDEIKQADKKEEFAQKRMPSKLHPRCSTLTDSQKAWIRDEIREYASGNWLGQQGRIYTDKFQNGAKRSYSILFTSMCDGIKLARSIEGTVPVKCYIIPHVQYSGREWDRPYSYFKLRIVWKGQEG